MFPCYRCQPVGCRESRHRNHVISKTFQRCYLVVLIADESPLERSDGYDAHLHPMSPTEFHSAHKLGGSSLHTATDEGCIDMSTERFEPQVDFSTVVEHAVLHEEERQTVESGGHSHLKCSLFLGTCLGLSSPPRGFILAAALTT